jgi:D-amino-acid oxidase
MPTQQPDILVLGAGVTGLTVAVVLAEAGARVTIVAEEIPGRTSLAAGAQWGPYLVEPKDQVRTWALESFAHFAELADDPAATGVRMTTGVEASRAPAPPPDFTDMVQDAIVLDATVRYTVPTLDMPVYLAYLRERARVAGTTVRAERLASLDEATGLAPVIVNATGIGARILIPDKTLYPIRGQLLVLENPGLTEWFSEDTGTSEQLTHWCPHGQTVILGGQARPDAYDMTPNPEIARHIHTRCAEIEPKLRDARILEHRVGLRPTRPAIRLDTETRDNSLIVHCYGHGGAGATLSWGCATEVRDLLP